MLLAACRAEEPPTWGVQFINPELVLTDEGVDFVAGVALEPSPAMLEALERGVSITFLVALRGSSGRVWLPILDQRRRHRFQISYLPLSRHYQLFDSHNDTRTSYPRLSMLIQALRQPRPWSIPLEGDEEVSRVRARIELDRTRLPSPMRLPTWFEAEWQLDSDWLLLNAPEPGLATR